MEHSMSLERWFFLLISVIVLFLAWTTIQSFVLTLLTAGIAAIVCAPIHERLEQLIKRKKLAAALLVFAVFLLIAVPIFFVLLLMVRQATELLQSSLGDGGWISRVQVAAMLESLPSFLRERVLALDLNAVAKSVAEWIFGHVDDLFSSSTKFAINTILFFIALYYLLADRNKLRREILILSPFRDTVDEAIMQRIVETVRSVVFGALMVAVTQGIFATIGMSFFGVPGSFLWGAAAVVAAQVPLVGVGLVMVPAIVYLFFTGDMVATVGLTLWSILVVGLVDNLLAPYLMKGTTHMHALLLLVFMLGGIETFGSIGLIVGPTVLSAVLVLVELYKAGVLQKDFSKTVHTSNR